MNSFGGVFQDCSRPKFNGEKVWNPDGNSVWIFVFFPLNNFPKTNCQRSRTREKRGNMNIKQELLEIIEQEEFIKSGYSDGQGAFCIIGYLAREAGYNPPGPEDVGYQTPIMFQWDESVVEMPNYSYFLFSRGAEETMEEMREAIKNYFHITDENIQQLQIQNDVAVTMEERRQRLLKYVKENL